MMPGDVGAWAPDWLWGVPLIIVTVVFHAYGLSRMQKKVSARAARGSHSATVIGFTALWATCLHALEAFAWAVAYRSTGALSDIKLAVLYSLNAMTSYGHENLTLAPQWRLLGALEALNGWILFGLTTAFLFTVLQKAWLQKDA
jgi:hypothetical protein